MERWSAMLAGEKAGQWHWRNKLVYRSMSFCSSNVMVRCWEWTGKKKGFM